MEHTKFRSCISVTLLRKLFISTGQVPLFPRHSPTKMLITRDQPRDEYQMQKKKRKFHSFLCERTNENNIKSLSSFKLVVNFYFYFLPFSHCHPSSLLRLFLLFSCIFSFSLPDCRIDRLRFLHLQFKRRIKRRQEIKMRSSSILAKLTTLASIIGGPSTSSTAFPVTDTYVIPTTCTASGQC